MNKFKLNSIMYKTDGKKVVLETNVSKAVDRRLTSKNSKGRINMNPPRNDCLGWFDKKQNKWIMAWEKKNEKPSKPNNN